MQLIINYTDSFYSIVCPIPFFTITNCIYNFPIIKHMSIMIRMFAYSLNKNSCTFDCCKKTIKHSPKIFHLPHPKTPSHPLLPNFEILPKFHFSPVATFQHRDQYRCNTIVIGL